MQHLFVFGDLVLDVVATATGRLEPDTDTPGEVRATPGGSAANFAVWTRRLGDPACFVTRVGDDLLGRALVADLREEGVEVHAAVDPTYPTAVLVLFSDGVQRHMLVPRGASHFLEPEDLPEERLCTAGWLHLTGYAYFWEATRRTLERAVAVAREAGVPISFDPSSAGFIRRHGLELPPGIRVLMPNRDEARALTGCADVEEAARRLARRADLVAVKLGPEGALLAEGDRLIHVPPVRPSGPAVDGTGSGDAWGAALIHGLRRGLDPYRAALRANRLGAEVVTRVGARPTLPTQILTQMGDETDA
ncbi:MAG: sugar kinase [Symbiobacterium sp.]|uniref:carbohydrate kinase family protein n=1 Tax=Symbiobacterium sp. TaxID=1971213 RepID=UPI0034647B67